MRVFARYQVARTSHFNATQRVVNGNGEGAATFFLASKHRHMPSAQDHGVDGDESAGRKRRPAPLAKGNKKGGGGGGGGGGGATATRSAAVDNPKQQLIEELGASGVKDPVATALVLYNGNQTTWGDVAWAFHSEGVEGLKTCLLDAGVEVQSITKIIARFVKERFEEESGRPGGSGGAATKKARDPDEDDGGIGGGLGGGLEALHAAFARSVADVQALHDGNRDVARRWHEEEADLGSFDLALQRIVALLNTGMFEGANALCKRLHAACPPPVGIGAPTFSGPVLPAPPPLSDAEKGETLHLSLSQQAMVFLQQAKAQLGLYRSGATEKSRSAGGVGGELEYAVFCLDEAIDRARGWALVDEAGEADSSDEEEAGGASAEADAAAEAIEAEEAAAAAAAGIEHFKAKLKGGTKMSKKRRHREDIRRRGLTGEEWASDALLCWSFETKGDVLSELESHGEAIEAFKASLRHLLFLRKKRAMEEAAAVAARQAAEQALDQDKTAKFIAAAIFKAKNTEPGDEEEEEVGGGGKGHAGSGQHGSLGQMEEAELSDKISREYLRDNDDAKAMRWEERGRRIRFRQKEARDAGRSRLDYLFKKLMDDAKAELAGDVGLERCSHRTPELRLKRVALLEELEDSRDELASAQEEAGGRAAKLAEAQDDLAMALKSESETVESSAFGARATYPVAEFRTLVERQVRALGGRQAEAMKRVRSKELETANLVDELEELEGALRVETGELMCRAVGRAHLIRCLAPNASNLLANDVTGSASGGVKLCAAAMGNLACAYDLETGTLMQVLFGQSEDMRKGERPTGHAAKITAVFLLQYRLFTGDHDGLVFVWDVSDGRGGKSGKKKKKSRKEEAAEAREMARDGLAGSAAEVTEVFRPPEGGLTSAQCVVDVLDDHDGAVTVIAGDAEKLVTGSADLTIKIWDAAMREDGGEATFALLFTLRGHAKSVTALQLSDFTFASGDASGQVRVWELIKPSSQGGADDGEVDRHETEEDKGKKWSRVRCVLKVRHKRSEDAQDLSLPPRSLDDDLADRLASLHHDADAADARDKAAALRGGFGGFMAAESGTLRVKKFLERDPGPKGRVRVHGITCLQYYGSELTCGDVHGKVFIWNIAEKRCMWDIQAHEGRVAAIQVDAIRVVTGGGDGRVRVFDVMTGRAVQTFQAHAPSTPVLLLQFDGVQLLTGGADGRLRRWLWSTATTMGEEEGAGERATKHFVGNGDSLKAISHK